MKNSIIALALSECFVLSASVSTQSTKAINRQNRPNILFCIADDASYFHFGANGCRWVNTPAFDGLAKQGILFSNCYTANAKSAPSRACVLTGLYSWQSREAGNHNANFPLDLKVVTEALAGNGYDVACTGKGWAPGNPGIKANGEVRELTGKPYQKRKLAPPTTGINVNDYLANFSDFLDNNKGQKPWFFWFGATEPHRPYEYASGETKGLKLKSMIDEFPAFWPDNDSVRTDMLDYAFEIEYFDKQIQRFVNELDKRGILENTIIVVTSDNGMPFPRCKANNYEYAAHMPLVVMWKNGISHPGRTVSDYVNFIDFTPTFLDVSHTPQSKSGMQTPSGKSLKSIFKNGKSGFTEPERHSLISGRERDDYGRPKNQGYPIRSIIKDNLMYIWNIKPWLYPAGNPVTGYLDCDGSPTKSTILSQRRNKGKSVYWNLCFGFRPEEELYDLSQDRFCITNLAYKKEYQVKKAALRMELMTKLKSQNDPRINGQGDIFDNYSYNSKEENAWNFWENVTSGLIEQPWKETGWVMPSDYESDLKE